MRERECVFACVCVRESACVCVVCVCERERERERAHARERGRSCTRDTRSVKIRYIYINTRITHVGDP